MSTNTSYRLSGTVLLIGGLLAAIGFFLQAFGNENDSRILTSLPVVIGSLITLLGSMLVLLGLPGIYARQAVRAGVLGLLGFLFAWYVILLTGVIQSFLSVVIVPELATNPATRSLAITLPPAFRPFFFVALLSEVLGPILLAIATLRARVFPRWTAWMLIATLVAGVVSFVPFLPPALGNLAAIIANLALAGFGYALLWPGRREFVQPTPARAQAEART